METMMTTTEAKTGDMVMCIKCMGTGKVCFKHIENGRCFQCQGTGKVEKRESRRARPSSRQRYIVMSDWLTEEDAERATGDGACDLEMAARKVAILRTNARTYGPALVWIVDTLTNATVWADYIG